MKNGFTIIELLLVILMISVAAGLMIPVFLRFQSNNDLDLAVSKYSTGTKRAQFLARSNELDSNWGISYQTGKIIVYKGNNFSGRDSSYDEEYEISPQVAISGLSDINYTKNSMIPSITGSATFTGVNNETKTVTINAKGIITY